MTAELDRAALEQVLLLTEPLTALADEEGLTELLDAVGWDGSMLGITSPAVFLPTVSSINAAIAAVDQILEQEHIELLDLATALLPLGAAVAQAGKAISTLTPASGVLADAPSKFAADIMDFLVEHYVLERFPRAATVAALLGVLKRDDTTQIVRPDGAVVRDPRRRRRIDSSALARALNDPLAYAHATFLEDPQGVQRTAEAIADLVGPELAENLITAGFTASYGVVPVEPVPSLTTAESDAAKHLLLVDATLPPSPFGVASAVRVALGLTDDTGGEGLGFLLSASGAVNVSRPTVNGTTSARLTGASQPLVITKKAIRLASGSTSLVQLAAELKYESAASAVPAVRLASGGTRLEVAKAQTAIAVGADGGAVDVAGEVDLTGLLIAVAGGDGDGFLSSVLPKDPIELRGDLGLELSVRRGIAVRGGASLEWRRGIGESLGPLTIEEIRAALRIVGDAARLELGANLDLALGPVRVDIQSLGLAAYVQSASTAHPGGSAGNLGPFDLTIGFKPPTGLGIAVDAGPVFGGGFISFEPDKGRYTGALQLAVASIQIKAIGILETKLPGGQPGYSFLIIVSAEFPPIQLGMGFTLNGVGGLAGIQRTMAVEALQAGIRSHAVDHILFPKDPVANAPQIISDLESFFPPAVGRYVFGPMALIAYGSGKATLVEAELGVLIELPAPIRLVLLGQIFAHLPSKEAAVAELHLDLIGLVEFAKRTVAIDATLHDSRIAKFPITGDMAMRLSYGEQPAFALALGGFNPRFTAPPAFPALGRLTITLSKDGGNPTIVCQSYFAITSNTVQFGARAEITGTALGFSIKGWLGFDVLVAIPPFSFIADLQAGVEVRKGSVKIASVALTGQLSGPAPWHLCGRAAFDFIVHYEVPIETTIGEAVAATVPPADPWPELLAAFEDVRNWRPVPGPAATVVASRRSLPEGQEPLLDPLGGAAIHQKACPLNRHLTKFGEAAIQGTDRFDVSAVTVGALIGHEAVQDYFAPAQFEELSDAERLSRPGFERMDSGFELQSDALSLGAALGEATALETVIVDDPGYSLPSYILSPEAQGAALSTSASARAGLGAAGEERFSPPTDHVPPVSLAEERFLIVDASTLKRPAPDPNPADGTPGKGTALQALEAYLQANPKQRGRAQVVPGQEAA